MNLNVVKSALMSTAVVLGVIYAMNQFQPTKDLVRKALTG